MPPRLRSANDPAYAVAGRYPGVSEDASEEDYREALATAEHAVQWAEALVAAGKAR
jgi:predicted urease superfamily metal-dependent hydrolase